jgi:cysteine-rich repeat protein
MSTWPHCSFLVVTALIGLACSDDDTNSNHQTNGNHNDAPPLCGDGKVDTGEQCDTGSLNSDSEPDACRTNCRLPYCGDGVRDAQEACDDGDDGTPDDCPPDCRLPRCGDGHVWRGHEVCDDGNEISGDGCRADCLQDERLCSNGLIDDGEQCDGGNLNNATCVSLGFTSGSLACQSCRFDTGGCYLASCGNATIDASEACDGNSLGGATCVSLGYLGGGALICTEGCALDTSECRTVCGNSTREPGEGCDDGDDAPGDGCSDACQVEPGWTCAGSPSACLATACGDGIRAGVEACDDGNQTPGDGCSATCRLETGRPCQHSGQCESASCVDDVCCEGACDGPCHACNLPGTEGYCVPREAGADPDLDCGLCQVCDDQGACVNASDGTDPKDQCSGSAPTTCGLDGECDGHGACRLWSQTTPCTEPSCSGETLLESFCDSGECQEAAATSCAPYSCDDDGRACRTSCSAPLHCTATSYCLGGFCIARLPNGQPCTDPNQCIDGSCVDGYCCNTVCYGTCMSCARPSALGTCGNIPNGEDPDHECTGDLVCNGAGSCVNP